MTCGIVGSISGGEQEAIMKILPSEYTLFSNGFPLWENSVGILIHPKEGVKGSKEPANVTTGRVDCVWRKDVYPATGGIVPLGGVPEEGIDVVGCEDFQSRRLVVWAPDGLIEVRDVVVYEELHLA